MNKSIHSLTKIIWLGYIAIVMVLAAAFTPAAIAQRGGSAGGGHGGNIRGPSVGPSIRGGPGAGARTVTPGMRGWGTAPRSMPNTGTPQYRGSSPSNRPMGRGPAMGTPRATSPQPRTVTPGMRGRQTAPRTAPNVRTPQYRGPSGNVPRSVPERQYTPGTRPGAGPGARMGTSNVTPRTPGQYRSGRYGSPAGPSGQPGVGTSRQTPRITPRQAGPRTPGQGRVGVPGRVPGQVPGTTGRRGGPAYGPGQARQQWNQGHSQHHGNWNHHGNWSHNNYWNWNNSSFYFGLYFYPGFAFPFDYGYWSFSYCGGYCSYSPFYYYGMPYVYAPRVVVVEVPRYTYVSVPDYSYGNNYYLAQGAYSGLNAALDDIRNGWIANKPDLILKYINAGTQVAIYLDNNYAYSLSGSDYKNMVSDAIKHINTVSFTIDKVEQRSDGAYTATGTHDFYDINNNHKVVNVSYTLAQQGGNWTIIAAGSSES
jgi:hypothetical protein